MKQGVRTLWIIISIALVVQLTHSINGLGKRGGVVEEAETRLQKVQEENNNLKEQAQYVTSTQFVEEQARNKLNMARPGEVVAMVPKASPTPTPSPTLPPKANWELWMEAFGVN
jgi:cell division protein FtsB